MLAVWFTYSTFLPYRGRRSMWGPWEQDWAAPGLKTTPLSRWSVPVPPSFFFFIWPCATPSHTHNGKVIYSAQGVVSSPAPAISLMDNPGILDTHMFVWTCGWYHSLIRNPTQNLCKKILIFFQITHFFQLFPPAKWLPLGIHKNNFSQSNPFLID